MITWYCANCKLPLTLVEKIPNPTCPNCNNKMTQVQDEEKDF